MSEQKILNDLAIQIATVNGSGSQSANNILTKSIFRMGIPVNGKNLFPSNISGLPTWFIIRANLNGYTARKNEIDMLVAMNSETLLEDVKNLKSGGVVVYDSDFNMDDSYKRKDVIWYPIPFTTLARQNFKEIKLRKLLTNMMYVGVLSKLLGLDEKIVKEAISDNFKGKTKAVEANYNAFDVGANYFAENLTKIDPYYCEKMNENNGKIMIDGNTAGALGTLFGGATFMAWYPITPASTFCEHLIEITKKYRIGDDGKIKFADVQAEDELAAVGMIIGAGWAGARSVTATSGPGISLMSELVGFAYYTEIPTVIWNVQRVGPSTGLPTRTGQADILSTYSLSHGDTKQIMLFPSNIEDCFDFGKTSLDLAERFQTPVFVLTDLDLGMNTWMSKDFVYPETPCDRGKILTAEDLDRLGKFERYRDVDGDGIPYRTLPGTNHKLGAYFTRGSGHDERAVYSEKPDVFMRNLDRINKKYETAKTYVPKPIVELTEGAEIGLIAYGSTELAMKEVRDILEKEGVKTNYLLLKAIPFTEEVTEFLEKNKTVYIIEQNRDAQVRKVILLEYDGKYSDKLKSVLYYGGWSIDAETISNQILHTERN